MVDSARAVFIRKSDIDEAPVFVAMESSDNTADFILSYSLEKHQVEMSKPGIDYYSIICKGQLAGFIIIAINEQGADIELRRIVVASRSRGIGQTAILALEHYCRGKYNCHRIWLDVFESNQHGRYLYEKLGFRFYKESLLEGRKLLFYEKFF